MVRLGVAVAVALTGLIAVAPVHSQPLPQQVEGPSALSKLVGNYRIAPDHIVGIDLYLEGGPFSLVYSDYRTGVIRRLSQSNDAFEAGHGFAVATPVEFTIRFEQDRDGISSALVIEQAAKTPIRAERMSITSREVAFDSNDARLVGTLLRPEGSTARLPAIVLLHGSGRLTRYSFGPYPHFFTSLGLAVLVYDKRGTGASTGRFFDRTTRYPDVFSDDAIEAVRFLRTQPEVDPTRVGVWGVSEGGMLATQVAAKSPDVAFAINSSGFMVPLWQQVLFNIEAQLKADGFSRQDVADAVRFETLAIKVMRSGEGWEEFQVAQGVAKQTKWFVAYFGGGNGFGTLESLRRQWDYVYAFDPVPALKSIRCPVLGVFGERDTSTPATRSAANLRREVSAGGNRNVTVRVFKRANHPLMAARTGGPAEMPSLGTMAPGVFDAIRDWITKITAAPRPFTTAMRAAPESSGQPAD